MQPTYWNKACKALTKADPVMGMLISQHTQRTMRRRSTSFGVLARAIVGQQISVKAAQSIWKRLKQLTGSVSPKAILAVNISQLRSCGLSEMKASYLKDLATHFVEGRLSPQRFRHLEDEELIDSLVAVKGIGRWTAEMFLMFHLLRPNVFPVDDLGLQRAVEKLYFKDKRLGAKPIKEFGERWQPYRTVATWYLWRSLDDTATK